MLFWKQFNVIQFVLLLIASSFSWRMGIDCIGFSQIKAANFG
jgi:hypothetical protein